MTGIAWTAVLRWSAQIVSWIATAVAARLLVPADYGIVSMAMLAVGLVRMVDDIGLDAVLVQDRGIGGESQARLAGLALLIGASASAAMVLLAQPIAAFFREPELAVVVSLLGTLTLIEALQVMVRDAVPAHLPVEIELRETPTAKPTRRRNIKQEGPEQA